VANTLTYYNRSKVTAVKRFIVQAHKIGAYLRSKALNFVAMAVRPLTSTERKLCLIKNTLAYYDAKKSF
jgi:hypothetical protein